MKQQPGAPRMLTGTRHVSRRYRNETTSDLRTAFAANFKSRSVVVPTNCLSNVEETTA
jgi:hypothetical protein